MDASEKQDVKAQRPIRESVEPGSNITFERVIQAEKQPVSNSSIVDGIGTATSLPIYRFSDTFSKSTRKSPTILK
jgi:hypothetical protein